MFSITREQNEKLSTWMEEQNKKVAHSDDPSEAYYGAIGGGFTFSFTPTSLGVVVKVKNNVTKEEIDLSDYDEW